MFVFQAATLCADPDAADIAVANDRGSFAQREFSCGFCKYVSRLALSSASQFVGETPVREAATHFCEELVYMDVIEPRDSKKCVERLMRKARDGGYRMYGITYMRTGDVCAYYGICKHRHASLNSHVVKRILDEQI